MKIFVSVKELVRSVGFTSTTEAQVWTYLSQLPLGGGIHGKKSFKALVLGPMHVLYNGIFWLNLGSHSNK